LVSGLQKYLNEQGFNIVGFGCTTCIGNSGELDPSVASAISENGEISNIVSVLEAKFCHSCNCHAYNFLDKLLIGFCLTFTELIKFL